MRSPRNKYSQLKISTTVLTCALLVFGNVAKICRAADIQAGNFIFILDASGSMAAQIQGRAKIDVAKEVLSGLIRDLPATSNVGLVAYGHRQKGDCTDVEELAPLSPLDKDGLIGKIRGLNPKGMTPLTYSVQKVAEGLKGIRQETTIVLVSDGVETCKGDPCSLVRELKASGVKFVLHVIGFDVTEKERAELACIAAAGGGSYYAARNAGEFKLAAQKAVEKTEASTGTLTIKSLINGQALRAYYEVNRFNGEAEDSRGEKIDEGWTENGSKALQLSPGVYDIKVENREIAGNPSVTFRATSVEPGRKVEKVADFSGGALRVKVLRNGIPSRGYCLIFKSESNETKEKEKITEGWAEIEPIGFKLPSGMYDVMVENRTDAGRPTVSLQGVTVETGKIVEKVAEFFGGELRIKALRNDKPFRAYCIIYRADTDEDKEKEKIVESWIETEGTSFKLAPGAYDIIVENQEDVEKPTVNFPGIAIEAGKALDKVADFSGGTLKIAAHRNGKPLSALCRVFTANQGQGKEGIKLTEAWTGKDGAVLKLQPGLYDVMVENQEDAGRPAIRFSGIAIELGKTVEKIAEFSGGTLKITAVRNGKPFSAYCTVFPSGQGTERKPITNNWTGNDGAVFQLLPGAYDVVVENTTDASKPKLNLAGISIESGKSVEKIAEFSGGTLKITAVRNGKPFSAYCTVFPSGQGTERKPITNNWTGNDGAVFQLLPGAYDVVVENTTDASKPKLDLAGIAVEGGKSVEKTAEFAGGTLKIKALRNGKPFSAYCTVFPSGQGTERKPITNNWTGNDGAVFQLLPGAYDVVVENTTDASKPKLDLAGIAVEGGKSVEKTAEFAGGTLKIKALRNGKPFSAYCTVFPSGQRTERKPITNNWTGNDGAVFQLLPGAYDVVVENTTDASKPKLDLAGIAVEGGKSIEKTAEFAGGTLKIKALRNGKPFSAYCTVFPSGQGTERKPITNNWTGNDGAVFQLLPGTYALLVEDQNKNPHEKKEIPEVKVEADKIQNIDIQF